MYFLTGAIVLFTILTLLPTAWSNPTSVQPRAPQITPMKGWYLKWYTGNVVNGVSTVDTSPGAQLHDPNGCTVGKPTDQYFLSKVEGDCITTGMGPGRQYFMTNMLPTHSQLIITFYEEGGCKGQGTVLTLFDTADRACNRAEKGDQVPIVVQSFRYAYLG